MTRPGRSGRTRAAGDAGAVAFLVLTGLLTIPFLVISAVAGVELLPGLPLASLAILTPPVAALAVTVAGGGRLRDLWTKDADAGAGRSGRLCWLAAFLVSPAVAVASFAYLRATGSGVPDLYVQPGQVLVLVLIFLASGWLEELGWSAFLLRNLQRRRRALVAGLIVGAAWAVWHYPALIEAGRSWGWIAWWTLGTMSMRLVMVWIFNGTGGSLASVTVFHAMSNLCWQLFPISGSWFDPRIHGMLTAVLALATVPALMRKPAARG